MVFLVLSSWAAEPGAMQCHAVWVGPRADCALEGTWTAEGAGRSERAARGDASKALADAARSAARAAAERTEGTMAAAATKQGLASCQRSIEESATVTCIAADGLAAYQMCFVDLVEDACAFTEHFTIETWGHEAFARGRRQMCAALERSLRAADADAPKVDDCAASCVQHTTVRCPGIPATPP
jgi:hypothetical protein